MGVHPFMQLNHPLLAPPVTLAMAQQLGFRHEGLLSRDNHVGEQERESESNENKDRASPNMADLPYHPAYNHKPLKDHDSNAPLNLHINGHAEDLRKSPSIRSEDPMSDDNNDIDDDNPSDDDKSAADSADLMETLSQTEPGERILQSPHNTANMSNGSLAGYSSIETLLLNIQGLLKVAGENARHQERQIDDLKADLMHEKKAREDIEKQLTEEQKQKNILIRRLKKERRIRRRLEERNPESMSNHVTNKPEMNPVNNNDKLALKPPQISSDEDNRERPCNSNSNVNERSEPQTLTPQPVQYPQL